MARTHTAFSIDLLAFIAAAPTGVLNSRELFEHFAPTKGRKGIYDALFRLIQQDFVAYTNPAKTEIQLTQDGSALLSLKKPHRDGVWKLVIFDIPERQRKVRTFLRNRLKSLGFKKWQSSIWASPYILDAQLEEELLQLAEKFFVRVIKTTDINNDKDLEALFVDSVS